MHVDPWDFCTSTHARTTLQHRLLSTSFIIRQLPVGLGISVSDLSSLDAFAGSLPFETLLAPKYWLYAGVQSDQFVSVARSDTISFRAVIYHLFYPTSLLGFSVLLSPTVRRNSDKYERGIVHTPFGVSLFSCVALLSPGRGRESDQHKCSLARSLTTLFSPGRRRESDQLARLPTGRRDS